ncbi:MAG TPA: HlyD family efflux transporter periplasmic adaptor subunit [Pirellulales bacterium]|nr:HlyD family efflux transporter periplasmic adaptor subunit [Pirellulales bacterium]
MTYRSVIIITVAGLAVAAAAYVWYSPGARVEAARAKPAEIREYVDEEGRTRLPMIHEITMPFAGRVEPIELIEGTPVKAGQVVARVVPLDLDLNVAEAQAAVERLEASIRENDDASIELTGLKQALSYVESMDRTVEAAAQRVKSGEAKLDYANKQLARMRALRERSAASEDQLNAAELAQVEADVDYKQDVLILSALRSLQAATALIPTVVRQYIDRKKLQHDVLDEEKAQAEVQLKESQRDRERGAMTSPIDGVVLERFETNERQTPAGTVLLSIGRLDELEAEADVLSQDVVNVKPGQTVEIYGPAVGPQPARGEVSRIYPAGFTKTSSLGVEQQRVKVVIRFADGELSRLRSERNLGVGYRIRARIYTAEKSQALVIPRSAIFRGPAGDWQAFVVRDGIARLQSLEIGLLNDERAEVTGGLKENELVILAPETNLVDGVRVEPVLPNE